MLSQLIAAAFYAAFAAGTPTAYAQEATYELDDIVVTASSIPIDAASAPRSITVVGRSEIDAHLGDTVAELIDHALGVDVRRRGAFGVQADIGIRGGTFEQTLVLVDGIAVNNPQTGHHSLDLPLSAGDIERIEIVRGHGSRLYGPNAVGGVINVVTRAGAGSGLSASAAGGQHGYAAGGVGATLGGEALNGSVRYGYERTDGHRRGAEFSGHSVAASGGWAGQRTSVRLVGGYSAREFGAYQFYSAAFPDEWEATESTYLATRVRRTYSCAMATGSVAWRRHDDDFVLDRTRPDWYRNLHTTDVVTGRLQVDVTTPLGAAALAGEIAHDAIESSSLGNHGRSRGGLFVEQQFGASAGIPITAGISLYGYSDFGWTVSPGIDVAVPVTTRSVAYASVGRSFRAPTFTDRYYVSPANVGNPDLEPEIAWSYEAGWRRTSDRLVFDVATFRRSARDVIDWARNEESDPWQAQNATRVATQGVEAGATWVASGFARSATIERATVSASYTTSDNLTDGSKYALDHIREQLVVRTTHRLLMGIAAEWTLRAEERPSSGRYAVLDAGISRRFGAVTLEFGGTNLLNASYVDAGFARQPGRWLRGGVRWAAIR